jgi:D-cysteine desulfhydrase
MGAQVHLVESSDHWHLEQLALDLCETLRSQGRAPYYIPVSGTTPHSCLGYVGCGLEIASQITDQGLHLYAVYAPFGTGGIFTGLLLALREKGITCPLIGISVNRQCEQCYESLERWWTALCRLLECDPRLSRMPFEIYDDFIGRIDTDLNLHSYLDCPKETSSLH